MIRKNRLNKWKPGFIAEADELLKSAIVEDYANHIRPIEEHFSHIALKLKDDFLQEWNDNDARIFLGQYCPVDFDPSWTKNSGEPWGDEIKDNLKYIVDIQKPFSVYINGKPVYKPYHHRFLKGIEVQRLYSGGNPNEKLLGFCWFAQTTGKDMIGAKGNRGNSQRKLSLYLNGFMIDTIRRDYLEAVCGITKPDNLRHYVGEIHVTDGEGIVPHDVRTSIIGGDNWEPLKHEVERILKNLVKRRTETSKFDNSMKNLVDASDFIAKVNSDSIDQYDIRELDSIDNEYEARLKIFVTEFDLNSMNKGGNESAKRKKFSAYPAQKNKFERMLDKLQKDREKIKQRKTVLESQSAIKKSGGISDKYKTSNSEVQQSDNLSTQTSGQRQNDKEVRNTDNDLNFMISAALIPLLVLRIMEQEGFSDEKIQLVVSRLSQEIILKSHELKAI